MKKISHPGNIVLIGFGGLILFMCYLVYGCTQNPSVMVSKNYYEQELKYQGLIDARTNTEIYSDSILLQKQQYEIIISIPSSLNKILTSANLQLYNYSDDKKDKTIHISLHEASLYTINTTQWGKGNYQLKLSMNSGTKQYYKEFTFSN